jgi:signal transduction histidine kinase
MTRSASWPPRWTIMRTRLTEVVQRDREFNADVSHELRTPLSVIRGAVE